ncbi:MAG: hypothetical protein PHC49_04475 [Desulfuromonadaceae bacterium]|nr:hypothetical protein [Desulfuromonadaceae bacterium]
MKNYSDHIQNFSFSLKYHPYLPPGCRNNKFSTTITGSCRFIISTCKRFFFSVTRGCQTVSVGAHGYWIGHGVTALRPLQNNAELAALYFHIPAYCLTGELHPHACRN